MGRPDAEFSRQLDAIRQQQAAQTGRERRLFVEATVGGEVGAEGGYGHLGQYARQITVTETRDMVFLADSPDAVPGCRQ